ncbi:hypothetical protein Ciccas_010729 [Cichlidogyrus casuarinus]|uniref:Taste receptor type 2 n=1 Tax=Cichlidogyrus casuarinus TaxID=1844966 RepID=A0ABD2PTC5_9PLAT
MGSLLALTGLVLLNLKPILIHILNEPTGVAGVTEFRLGSKSIFSSGTSTPFTGWLILNLQYLCFFLLSFLGPQSIAHLTLNLATSFLAIVSVCEYRFVCERMGGRDSHIMGRISRAVESWQLAIVCSLLLQLSFFQVGAHQTTLSAIPWNAAFQMHSDSHGNNIIPALSVMLHLFSGPIILSSCLPLFGFLFLLHRHADSQVSLELSLAQSRHETSPLTASVQVLIKRILIVLLTWVCSFHFNAQSF